MVVKVDVVLGREAGLMAPKSFVIPRIRSSKCEVDEDELMKVLKVLPEEPGFKGGNVNPEPLRLSEPTRPSWQRHQLHERPCGRKRLDSESPPRACCSFIVHEHDGATLYHMYCTLIKGK